MMIRKIVRFRLGISVQPLGYMHIGEFFLNFRKTTLRYFTQIYLNPMNRPFKLVQMADGSLFGET